MSKSNLNLHRKELKRLSAQLQHLLADSSTASSDRIRSLVERIRSVLQRLKGYLGRRELRRILGAAAVFFGLSLAPALQAQTFGTPQSNPFGLSVMGTIAYPSLVDIDGDGDLDMLAGGADYDAYYYPTAKLYFFENTGSSTMPQFAAPVVNPFGIDVDTLQSSAIHTSFGDIDGDGDMDAIITGWDFSGLAYYENTGTAQAAVFGSPVINPFSFSDMTTGPGVELKDLDGDGDLDIMFMALGPIVNYSENTGTATAPSFASPQSFPFGIQDPGGSYQLTFGAFGDVDGDGDMDMISANYYDGSLIYLENNGSSTSPQFAAPVSNPSWMPNFGNLYAYPHLEDLDGDGDVDLILGLYDAFAFITGNEQFAFVENTTQGGVSLEELKHDLNIYPNLVTDYINLEVNDAEIGEVLIFDQAGKMLLSIGQQAETIDVSQLAMGSYVLQVILDDGRVVSSEFVKN